MAKQYAFYFDANSCIDCKACQVACQDKNDLPGNVIWRRVIEYGGGDWVMQDNVMVPNGIFTYALSTSCMHCQDPICVHVCPSGAMTKRDDGIVLVNEDICLGCRYCEWACPYAAPAYRSDLGVMTKCTFCEDLLAVGENPACVDACVTRALDFGELSDLRAKYGDVDEMAPLPDAKFTSPSFVLTPYRASQETGSRVGKIIDLAEEF
jgi:anaerobic dimethyl sulfoxide reductase subunit B (iron-sulfur subunit)